MVTHSFIFARGGSKGLSQKNIKLLCGKPLICYSIELAQRIPWLDKVFVSTDDEKIAEVARMAGAIVIDRPRELATDTSPEWLSWQHAVAWVEQRYGAFDTFISLPATSPLRSEEDVTSSFDLLNNSEADICIGVTPAARSPYFNMVSMKEDGDVDLIISEQKVTRRQDAPAAYDITTAVYTTTPQYIKCSGGVFTGRVKAVVVPKERSIDIDDIYDFEFAKTLLLLEGK